MPTTDINGLPQFVSTDPAELDVLLNLVTASVSNALGSNIRPFLIAGTAARLELTNTRPPTKENPLLIWRQDLGKFEFNDGTGWRKWPEQQDISDLPPIPGPNELLINGVSYKRTGISPMPSYSLVGSSPLFYRVFTIPMPYKPPAGWGFAITSHLGGSVPSSIMQVGWGESGAMSIMISCVRRDGLVTYYTWELIKIT